MKYSLYWNKILNLTVPWIPFRPRLIVWWRFVAVLFTTVAIVGLGWLGVGQAIDTWFYRLWRLNPALAIPGWWEWLLMGWGLGLGRWLVHYPLGLQLKVLGGLCLGWGLLSSLLVVEGYSVPVLTPIALMASNGAGLLLAECLYSHRQLRQSEERYALAARGSNEGIWDWNLRTNHLYFSSRWQAMMGYPEGELDQVPQTWFDRVHAHDLTALKAALEDHLAGRTPYFEQEYRVRHRDGSYRWMLGRGVVVHNRDGKPERVVGSQTDITQRKQTESELWRSVFFDQLTGLPNRAGFNNHLQQAIARVQHQPMAAFAVLWIDIDRFKVINNSLGSAIGDRLLIATAQRLRSFAAPDDLVARMGGDEFAILLNQSPTAGDASRTAERVQQVLALPFVVDGREVYLTVSIGIAFSNGNYTQSEHLLQDADTAMHRAKAAGRSRYQIFDQTMRVHMVGNMLLENDLRRVIAQYDSCQELQLYYQPIVCLTTGVLSGFEALVRWQHPEKGILAPTRFIAMAEETGLIIPLSWWVLRSACQQMRRWQLDFPEWSGLTINVNLSSQQFSTRGLPDLIEQILQETELPAPQLKLEMTETLVMENAASVIAMLHHIRDLGIQLAIDDFGTGYSSLSYLARFPINTLKVDRSFVRNIDTSSDSWEIVRAILILAHNLGMDVTAEGVETQLQIDRLLTLGCEYGQGFFFSQPLDAEGVLQLLARSASQLG